MISWLLIHGWAIVLGYVVCVLFPIPKLNSWIIEKWAIGWNKVWTWIKSKF